MRNPFKRKLTQEVSLSSTTIGHFISIPANELRELSKRYFAAMETGVTEEWCKCLWAVHPDDVAIGKGRCRQCNEPHKSKYHKGLPEDFEQGYAHKFLGRRMRKVDDHPECPVHTREGMLIYFFEWVMNPHD